ncbi:MAG: FHA domain-containing protein [Myxococcaceae bacterium]
MSERLSQLSSTVLANPRAWAKLEKTPLLVWEKAPVKKKGTPLVLGTLANIKLEPPAHDPLCFRLRKYNRVGNAFALGITLGRAEFNDIPLDDGSVSRFHAYFQQDRQSGIWHVVDAESFNGSSVDGVWLQPNRPAPLRDRVELKFGNIEMRFFTAESFGEWVAARPAALP